MFHCWSTCYRCFIFLLSILFLASLAPGNAGEPPPFEQLAYFPGHLGTVGDRDSYSAMAREGDLLAIGVPLFDTDLEDVGRLLIYRLIDEVWTLEDSIIGSGEGEWLGTSLVIAHGQIIVGAPGHNQNGSLDGALLFYERGADGWELQRQIQSTDGGCFGIELAHWGDWLFAGDPCISGDGVARVFKYDGSWVEQTPLTIPGGVSVLSKFGRHLVVAEGTLFGPVEFDLHILDLVGEEWQLQQSIPNYGIGPPAASADTVAAFNHVEDSVGLFQEQNGSWQLMESLPGVTSWSGPKLSDDYLSFDFLGELYLYRRTQTGLELELSMPGNGNMDAASNFGIVNSFSLLPSAGFEDQWIFHDTVYRRQDGGWLQDYRLGPTGSGSMRGFGANVALDGDTAIVTAPGRLLHVPGKASIYEGVQGSWREVTTIDHAKLDLAACEPFDNGRLFGISVALSGDTAFIGANRHTDPSAGTLVVLRRSTAGWEHTQTFCGFDSFGNSVEVDGDLAVSIHHQNLTAFQRIDDVWEEIQSVEDEAFGSRVSLDGNRMVADLQNGFIRVLEFDGTAWVQVVDLAVAASGMNTSVALSGDLIVLGSPFDGRGVVSTFIRQTGAWIPGPELTIDGGTFQFRFGWHLDLDGDRLAVSAQDGLRMYTWTGDSWLLEREMATLPAPDNYQGDIWSGTGSVSLQGDNLLFGTPLLESPGLDGGGAFFFGTFQGLFRDGFETEDTSAWGFVRE